MLIDILLLAIMPITGIFMFMVFMVAIMIGTFEVTSLKTGYIMCAGLLASIYGALGILATGGDPAIIVSHTYLMAILIYATYLSVNTISDRDLVAPLTIIFIFNYMIHVTVTSLGYL